MVWIQVLVRVLHYTFQLLDVLESFVLRRYLMLQKHSITAADTDAAAEPDGSSRSSRLIAAHVVEAQRLDRPTIQLVGSCYTIRIQGSTDQSGRSSASVLLSFKEQTSSVYGDWLSDYIQELLETYDQPCHEEMRKLIIDEIPWLYGISRQAEVEDTTTRARLSKIKKLLSDMSVSNPQICQWLQEVQERLLSAGNVVIPQDEVLDFVDYNSDDEETATNDFVDYNSDDEETATNGSSSTSTAVCSSYSRTLDDEIHLLLDLFDKHEHEEIRNCVINEIPLLIGMDHSPQAVDDALRSARRSLEIHRRRVEMSLTDDQSRQLLMLMKKHQPVKEDDELEFVGYPSDDDDEENDTDDEMVADWVLHKPGRPFDFTGHITIRRLASPPLNATSLTKRRTLGTYGYGTPAAGTGSS